MGALGGALVLGGLPRLMRTARIRYAVMMGVGIAILVLTRPYEGFLLCLPVGVVLGRWMWKGKNRPSPSTLVRLIVAPLAMGLAAVAWMGYYDYRAFGDPLTPPYTVDRNTYAIAPYYVWQHERAEPAYRHPEMRRFYHKDELGFFNQIHSVRGFVPHTLEKVGFTFLFYAGFLLLIPMIMVRRVFFDHRVRFLILCVAVTSGGLVIEIFLLAHYVSPITVAFYAIGLQAMRHLRVWKPEGKPVGKTMVRLTVTACVLLAGLRVFARPLGIAPLEWPPSNWNFTWFGPEHYGVERAQIEARLEQLPGKQLVIVRYAAWHDPLAEWVYNGADIDDSKVVWARDMGPSDNLELIHYYQDRKVWLVEPDAVPARITPYPRQSGASGDSGVGGARGGRGLEAMINGKRIAVVMPAYNAEKTLEQTVRELSDVVDIKILVDDSSKDKTAELSRKLGVQTFVHDANYGYGRNQQTCYREALAAGADIVVMVHPDYQYTPLLVPAMAGMVASGVYDMVLGSRILGGGALKGGMPLYKYVANRLLTAFQNLFLGVKLSEYHTGFRAFSRELLETLPLLENSDDFVFDNQMIAQAVMFGFRIGEISCPTKYFEEASSINFRRSVKYGLGVLATTASFVAHKTGIRRTPRFDAGGRKVTQQYYSQVERRP